LEPQNQVYPYLPDGEEVIEYALRWEPEQIAIPGSL